MEEDLSGPSFSWWSDSHNRPGPHQSPWLQAVLSDLDDKVKTIINLIKDDGDSFTERAEMFYKRRPELLNMLKDLHISYRLLAEKYHSLTTSSSSSSSSLKLNTKIDENQTSSILNIQLNTHMDESITLNGKSSGEELRVSVSKLIEDNRRQQAELIRRNDEKRQVIKQLRAQITRLMDDNRALINCLPTYKQLDLKPNQPNNNNVSLFNCIGKFHY